MRMYLTKAIDLQHVPELMRLAEEGEELKDLQKLPPETILIRWINYHLKKKEQERKVKNLGADLKDSIPLIYVLNSLDSTKCSLDALNEEDTVKRADMMIKSAEALGVVPALIRPYDIISGNVKLNTVFVASIFNHKHGLESLNEEEKEAYEAAKLIDDDIEGSREERAFRLWINSLNIEDLYVTSLSDEARDGLLMLKIIHKLNPNVIDWKKVDKNPNNKFKQGVNCGLAIEACKKLAL